jgi:hypothetical protein
MTGTAGLLTATVALVQLFGSRTPDPPRPQPVQQESVAAVIPRADTAPVLKTAGIAGRWILRRENLPPDDRVTWMRVELAGSDIEVFGESWRGKGKFDGRSGYYDWQFVDGRTGTTRIQLDDTGVLHGTVVGSEIDWSYWATREID